MRDFLRAHLIRLLAFMSGIVSVVSWLVAAIMEYKDYSVPARVSFYFGGIASSILASFFVWKRTNDTANKRIAERDSEIAKLREQLADKTNELAEHGREREAERAAHQEELHQAQTGDPAKNAIRKRIEQYIRKFEELATRAEKGPLPAPELYDLEFEAHNFFPKHFPQYEDFGKGPDRIIGSHSPGQTVKADEALRRCQTRLARLREALDWLS